MATRFVLPLFSLGILLLGIASGASADLAIVVHRDSPLKSLSAEQVSDLYLGRSHNIAAGDVIQVLEQPRNSVLRKQFYQRLNGMPIRQVNAYWARLQFSGEIQPPQTLPNSQAVLAAVRGSREAIGYVESSTLDSNVRAILLLKD